MFEKYRKEKLALIDKELEVYKEKKILEIDKDLFHRQREIQTLAIQCSDDTKTYEHTFHLNREKLGIEIAKLEARKESLQIIENQDKVVYERLLSEKDKEIDRLRQIVSDLTTSLTASFSFSNINTAQHSALTARIK